MSPPSFVATPPRPRSTAGGRRVQAFVETYIRQSRGRWAGLPLKLEPWQVRLLDELFRTSRDGSRVYREALVGLPRKNGKSTIGASIALYLLLADDEPGAEVYSAAASRDQARIVFDEAKRAVEAHPVLSDRCKVFRGHIEDRVTGGIYRVLAADAPRLHGLNPSGVVIDELHAHRNPELYYALTTGSLARENPLVVSITTAGYDRESICREVFNRGLDGDDDDFLFYWIGAREDDDFADPKIWNRANPASWIGEEDLRRQFESLPLGVFARLHLNVWTQEEEVWLPAGAWRRCRSKERIAEGEEVFVGVDVGLRHDRSAVVEVARRERQGKPPKFVVRSRIFEPAEAGGRLDLATIENYLLSIANRQTVIEVSYDPYFFQRSAEDLSERLNMVEFPMTNERVVPASQNLHDLILEGRLLHNGDPKLADHVSAAAVKETERGWRISKAKAKNPIDALIALMTATARASSPDPPPTEVDIRFA